MIRPAASSASWLRWAGEAQISLDLRLAGCPFYTGGFIVEVAHSRGSQLGEDRLEHCARLWCELPGNRGHPVGALATDDDAATATPVSVGVVAVLIDEREQAVGDLAEPVRIQIGGMTGQLALCAELGLEVHADRQLGEELAYLGDVFGPDDPLGLTAGHVRHQGLQRFARQRDPRAKVGGLCHPPLRIGGADPQPRCQRPGQLGPEFLGGGLGGQAVDQPMLQHGRLARQVLPARQHGQDVRGAQRVELDRRELVLDRLVLIEEGNDPLPIRARRAGHIRTLVRPTDKIGCVRSAGSATLAAMGIAAIAVVRIRRS